MSKPVVQRPQADLDIDGIVRFLRRESVTAASRFLDAVEVIRIWDAARGLEALMDEPLGIQEP